MLNFFKKGDVHVRISEKGWDVLKNKPLADNIASAIIANKEALFICGATIQVENISIKSATNGK